MRSKSLEQLVDAVQALSLARDVDAVAAVVRRAARQLTGADGATFVLRDGDRCFYVDEDAISPLWKGQRFPLSACISGWSMLNRSATVIEDIYADARVPHAAYRPTFVRSLVMVPIRTRAPIGAIGNYWASRHRATEGEVQLLQALADSTSVAMENVQVYAELEARVQQRTQQLKQEIEVRREAQAEVERLSRTDALTGLLNRRGFFDLAEKAFVDGPGPGRQCHLLYADLDGLKACNDLHGHAAGDAMIREAASVLARVMRGSDILARIGGDEFAALLLSEDGGACHVDERLHAALAEHNRDRPSGQYLRLSVGVVRGGAEDSLDQLLAEADRAMYVDKQRRRA